MSSKEFGICSNCIFWDIVGEEEIEIVRKCKATPQLWNASEWDEDYDYRQLKDEHKEHGSFVQDGSDYSARLLTQSTFGCNEFKAKPAE